MSTFLPHSAASHIGTLQTPPLEPPKLGHDAARASRTAHNPAPNEHCSPHSEDPDPDGLDPPGSDPHSPANAVALRFASASLRTLLEVLDHRRSPRQVSSIASPTVVDVLSVLAAAHKVRTARTHAAVMSVHTTHAATHHPAESYPAETYTGVFEVFATVRRGGRIQAVAGRVEMRRGRWSWVVFTTA